MKISKAVRWSAIAVLGTLVVLAIVAAAGSRTEPLRRLVIAALAERLDSNVELRAFSVDTFPRVVVRGEGLTLRLRGQPGNLPPLIQIDSFTVHSSLMDLMRRPRRFRLVTLDGLVVSIPPGGFKIGAPAADASAGPETQITPRDRGKPGQSPILIDVLTADGALLRIIPRRQGKDPKEFAIHALTMTTLGLAEKMPFRATLTNPLPKGLIETSGTFGPWRKDDPGSTPLGGDYSFQKADLGTIKGIGGILDSTGKFDGELDRINVKGTTTTPDFHLDTAKQPVALSTSFVAVVDGTDGDTYLEEVHAQFLSTTLTAKGAVVGTKGIKGRTVDLNVRVHEGRIEDLLRLAVKGDKPLLVGRVALQSQFHLPPGEPDVIERLELNGRFGVAAATFTNRKVQGKLAEMSRRARGLDEDASAGNVVSNLSGSFALKNTILRFSTLSFSLPGADVRLRGSYGLRSEAIEFDGIVRMDATISKAVGGGGVKGLLLKLVDPIFRKQGTGAVIPIKIRGTRDDPSFGLDVGRVFKSK
jgi:AsmA-like C-terminal region